MKKIFLIVCFCSHILQYFFQRLWRDGYQKRTSITKERGWSRFWSYCDNVIIYISQKRMWAFKALKPNSSLLFYFYFYYRQDAIRDVLSHIGINTKLVMLLKDAAEAREQKTSRSTPVDRNVVKTEIRNCWNY